MKFATSKERIIQLIDFKGINKSEFYRETGLKRGILDTDKLKQSLSDSALAIIIAKFPDINPEWLLTGKGPMLREGTPPQAVPVMGCAEQLAAKEDIIRALREQIITFQDLIKAKDIIIYSRDGVVKMLESQLQEASVRISELQKDKRQIGKSLSAVRREIAELKKSTAPVSASRWEAITRLLENILPKEPALE